MNHDLFNSHANANALAYERIGSGPPILFIHGLTYDRRMWRPVIRRLSHDHTCIAIDLPGHGTSRPAKTYDFESVAQTIYATVERLGIAAPIVVAHSMAALYALVYAANFPVAGLVTSDLTLTNGAVPKQSDARQASSQRTALTAIWNSMARQLGIDRIDRVQSALLDAVSTPRCEAVLGYWREALETPAGELHARLADYARRVDAPFSAIFSDDVADDYAPWLQTIAPRAEIVIFPNSGHFPHLVHIDRFVAEVRFVNYASGMSSFANIARSGSRRSGTLGGEYTSTDASTRS